MRGSEDGAFSTSRIYVATSCYHAISYGVVLFLMEIKDVSIGDCSDY